MRLDLDPDSFLTPMDRLSPSELGTLRSDETDPALRLDEILLDREEVILPQDQVSDRIAGWKNLKYPRL